MVWLDAHSSSLPAPPGITNWSLVIGHSSLVIGHWSFVIGHWSLVIGHSSLVIGHWSLVIRHSSLVTGHWSLVTGHWSGSRKPQAQSTKHKAQSTKHKAPTYRRTDVPTHRRTDVAATDHLPPTAYRLPPTAGRGQSCFEACHIGQAGFPRSGAAAWRSLGHFGRWSGPCFIRVSSVAGDSCG